MNVIARDTRPGDYDDTPLEIAPDTAHGRFTLHPGETLSGGLKRVLVGEIVSAREALADPAIGREEAIHRVRRRLKRARSLLAVLDEVPGADRDGRVALLRDTARLLSGARDADVVAREARRVLARAEGATVAPAATLVERLENEQAAAHGRVPPLDAIAARLRAGEADVRSLPARFEAGRLLAAAIVEAHRRGRRDWRALGEGLDGETLHDWRKRVKQRRHLSALVPIETSVTTAAIQHDLGRLGEILGEERDLALLTARLGDDRGVLRPREGRDAVRDLVERRRRKLAKKALELGDELYGTPGRDVAVALEGLSELC